jgi:hypothetical protein
VNLSPVWIAPLVAGALGAAALVGAAAIVRKEVAQLQRSMRPLRVKDRIRSTPPGGDRTP